MPDDEYENDNEGWVEPDDFFCYKCDCPVKMPKWDGPYEYYDETDIAEGRICPECNRQLCEKCANWQRNDEGRLVCFDCYDKERHFSVDLKFHKAIIFACKKHGKQYRKSTDIPYISHIMEVMSILMFEECTIETIIAGILHDTLEDTETTDEEIRSLFGANILSIVKNVTEDKSKSWFERKEHTILSLPRSLYEVQLVCCADKLSNLRSIYADLQKQGEKVWERFNAPKEKQKWYYEGILRSLRKISDTDMYNELEELIEAIFNLDWSSYGED